jgi:hypothetical protein
MARSLVIITLAIGLSVAAMGGVLARWHWERAGGVNALNATADLETGDPIFEIDPRDDRALAAYATDIFIGKVLRQTGAVGAPTSAPGQEIPQSQFAVDVLHAIKGKAEGVVTINQVGGLDRDAGQIMLLAGDTLLRPGASEVFLLVFVPERKWYQIVAGGHGHLPVGDEARRAALIERFAQTSAPPGVRNETFVDGAPSFGGGS